MISKLCFSHTKKKLAIAMFFVIFTQACQSVAPSPTPMSTFEPPIRPVGTTATLKVVAERRGKNGSEPHLDAVFTVRYQVTAVDGDIVTISTSSDDAATDSFPFWTNKVYEFNVLEKRKLTPKEGWEYILIKEFENTLSYKETGDWVNDSGFRFVCSGTINRDALSGIMLSDNYECEVYDNGGEYLGKDKFVTTLTDFQEP
jgi:hypothetical protein